MFDRVLNAPLNSGRYDESLPECFEKITGLKNFEEFSENSSDGVSFSKVGDRE